MQLKKIEIHKKGQEKNKKCREIKQPTEPDSHDSDVSVRHRL